MKSLCNITVLLCVTASLWVFDPPSVHANVLLQQQHLTYKGAFRVPRGNLGGDSSIDSMGRGGKGITYNAAKNSLILLGSQFENLAIEISIPQPVISNNISELNTSTTIQPPGNITNSKWNNLNLDGSAVGNGGTPGGLLVYDGKLIGNVFAFYATGYVGHLSHFTASLNWATEGSQFSGMKRVGTNPTDPALSNGGFTGGYMCHVPNDWKERLGAPALTGNGAIPVISRSSYGPSIWGFDPNDIGVTAISPAEMFVGYDDHHQTLGGFSIGNLTFNMVTALRGIVFPDGSDSILVFGRHGLGHDRNGVGCYGTGTSNEALHLTDAGDGSKYCYDPVDGSKGVHGYPYVYQIWAYDANDILNVRKGVKNYWDITPYAVWNFTLPYTDESSGKTGTKSIGGVAYDPTAQRLFISQLSSDIAANAYETPPIIHVFSLNLAITTPPIQSTPIILNIK